ncbi:SigE family RNA polymerase sigma factor [Serinicoccus kebangsaanensis]|uniref:SigE family RNA polymerase sigma factor n=1 Tax=Serinicoccus kebangsaanensis TaxID=2602069 RepID=UPI00124EE328|nr:SigE family RNA polymerase sigma factor [Serinicoccus kebangsaanensis]
MERTSRRVDEDFAVFVGAHQHTLQRAAYLLCGDRDLARDLTQEALTRTAKRWPRVRDGLPLAYARRILYTANVDRWRRTGSEVLTDVLPERSSTDHERWVTSIAVRDALQQLPPRARAVIVLRYFEDLDVATTAQTLGISDGTVKSQTSDGIRRLRELLTEVSTDA